MISCDDSCVQGVHWLYIYGVGIGNVRYNASKEV